MTGADVLKLDHLTALLSRYELPDAPQAEAWLRAVAPFEPDIVGIACRRCRLRIRPPAPEDIAALCRKVSP